MVLDDSIDLLKRVLGKLLLSRLSYRVRLTKIADDDDVFVIHCISWASVVETTGYDNLAINYRELVMNFPNA